MIQVAAARSSNSVDARQHDNDNLTKSQLYALSLGTENNDRGDDLQRPLRTFCKSTNVFRSLLWAFKWSQTHTVRGKSVAFVVAVTVYGDIRAEFPQD